MTSYEKKKKKTKSYIKVHLLSVETKLSNWDFASNENHLQNRK